VIAWLVACAGEESDPPDACAPEGLVSGLATGFSGTEGAAYSPDGRLFVTEPDAVDVIDADGSWASVAAIPSAVGLAWWGDALMVASADTLDGSGGIWRLDVDSGASSVFATGIARANFATVTPWGTLLVSDDFDTQIFEVEPTGSVTTWLAGIDSPNGMAFTADGATLYVATTFATPATLWAIPAVDGRPGTPRTVATWEPGIVPDGVAMTADDRVLVALNVAGRVDRVGADGSVTTIASGVAHAASLAYAPDSCDVVATSLGGDAVSTVSTGTAGGRLWR
jgi:DNA-binding beta-propeller fold protein YncE